MKKIKRNILLYINSKREMYSNSLKIIGICTILSLFSSQFLLVVCIAKINILYNNSLKLIYGLNIDKVYLNAITIINKDIALAYIYFSAIEIPIIIFWGIFVYFVLVLIKILFDILLVSLRGKKNPDISYDRLKFDKECDKILFPKLSKLVITILIISGIVFSNILKKSFDFILLINSAFTILLVAVAIIYIYIWYFLIKKEQKNNVIIEKYYITNSNIKDRLINILYFLLFLGSIETLLIPSLKAIFEFEYRIVFNLSNISNDYVQFYNLLKESKELSDFTNYYPEYNKLIDIISISRGIFNNLNSEAMDRIKNGFYIIGGLVTLLESITPLIISKNNPKIFKRLVLIFLEDIFKSIIIAGLVIVFTIILFNKGKISDILSYNSIYVMSIMFLVNQIIENTKIFQIKNKNPNNCLNLISSLLSWFVQKYHAQTTPIPRFVATQRRSGQALKVKPIC